MGDNEEIQKVPYNDINDQQLELLPQHIKEGKIHEDFIITHPSGNYPVCGHATRNELTKENGHNYCLLPAGWGTDHFGKGFCKLHGGKGRNKIHGRYSKYIKKSELAQRHENFMYDPKILSLNEEIAVLRSLLVELLESKDTLMNDVDDLRRVPEKFRTKEDEASRRDLEKRYRGMFNKIQDLIQKITATVETKNRIEHGEKHTIRIETLHFVTVQIIDVIKRHVTDPTLLKKIGYDIKSLQLPE